MLVRCSAEHCLICNFSFLSSFIQKFQTRFESTRFNKIASTRFTDRFQSSGWEKKKKKNFIFDSSFILISLKFNSLTNEFVFIIESLSRTTGAADPRHVAPRNYSTRPVAYVFTNPPILPYFFSTRPRYASSQGDSEILRPGIVRLVEGKLPRVRVTVRCSSYK